MWAKLKRLLVTPAGQRWVAAAGGRGFTVTDAFGRVDTLERVRPWAPSSDELRVYEGTYASPEAEAEFSAAIDEGRLVLRQRPDRVISLLPAYEGAFTGTIGTVVFRRDASGRVAALSVSQDRVWDLRFFRRVRAER